VMAFVGKEAYRGPFGERAKLGLQARSLGDTRLFVLPSTSPANAAVPWVERLRWFRELAALVDGLAPRPTGPTHPTGPRATLPVRSNTEVT
jgi:G:T/U-mismatch repair DNA glycosylase